MFTALDRLGERLREMSAHSFMQHAVLGLSALVLPGEWRKRGTWVALVLVCGGRRGIWRRRYIERASSGRQ